MKNGRQSIVTRHSSAMVVENQRRWDGWYSAFVSCRAYLMHYHVVFRPITTT